MLFHDACYFSSHYDDMRDEGGEGVLNEDAMTEHNLLVAACTVLACADSTLPRRHTVGIPARPSAPPSPCMTPGGFCC